MITPTFRSGRKSLMGPIIRLETSSAERDVNGRKKGGGLNGTKYVNQVIKGALKDFLNAVREEEGRELLVVEDGAPCHQSTVTQKARKEVGIKNLGHPPNSPDLNPMEPLWLLLKNRVADIRGAHNNLENLWWAIQRVWEEITIEEIQQHTGKMRDRVDAVIRANGFYTPF
ncbi:hypothetical protein CVT26_000627 [Gymnopilus dilepis]|uniref:Tc1-like transposase DDE domain-containing protein n=1 Tax=Gymnopilus dilepis TaxID=231916 RepID=A0A409Y2E6_9AGAR|nr:hypothetical protein CVT26_000627 [Gymnopilus dilepis]